MTRFSRLAGPAALLVLALNAPASAQRTDPAFAPLDAANRCHGAGKAAPHALPGESHVR